MNLQETNLNEIMKDIETEISRDLNLSKSEIFENFIRDRLQTNLKSYNDEISNIVEFLEKQQSNRVIKALNKIKKTSDKDVINQNLISDKN